VVIGPRGAGLTGIGTIQIHKCRGFEALRIQKYPLVTNYTVPLAVEYTQSPDLSPLEKPAVHAFTSAIFTSIARNGNYGKLNQEARGYGLRSILFRR
jgi:hypothetical protein